MGCLLGASAEEANSCWIERRREVSCIEIRLIIGKSPDHSFACSLARSQSSVFPRRGCMHGQIVKGEGGGGSKKLLCLAFFRFYG